MLFLPVIKESTKSSEFLGLKNAKEGPRYNYRFPIPLD